MHTEPIFICSQPVQCLHTICFSVIRSFASSLIIVITVSMQPACSPISKKVRAKPALCGAIRPYVLIQGLHLLLQSEAAQQGLQIEFRAKTSHQRVQLCSLPLTGQKALDCHCNSLPLQFMQSLADFVITIPVLNICGARRVMYIHEGGSLCSPHLLLTSYQLVVLRAYMSPCLQRHSSR